MPNLEYGGGASLEDVLMRKLGGGYATAAPAVPAELMTPEGPGAPAGTVAPASFSDKIMKGLKDYGPLISQLGTALMRPVGPGAKGQETVGSQLGGAITGALESQKLNEALRKMISTQLAGGGKSFSEGQPVGLEGADVVGLTPEQISGIYGIGLKVRESELKRPMEAINTISDAYLKIMSGEAKPAEIESHLANAQKAYQEIAAAPVKNLVDLVTKIQAMDKARAEIDEIKARTETEKGKPAAQAAETKLKAAEEKKVMAGLDPEQIQAIEAAKTAGGAVRISDAGDRLIVTDPKTGREKFSFPIGAKPETVAKTKAEELPMKKFAMQRIAPLVVRQLETEMAALPGGKQKVDLQNLISSLRGYTGEIDPGVLLAKSSPELQDKFNKLMDIYVKTPGLSETEFGGIVQSILGVKATTPAPPTPAPAKPVTEKFRRTAANTPPIADFTVQLTKEYPNKPGTYNSKSWVVKWDGKAITSIEPAPPEKAAPAYNFGTY